MSYRKILLATDPAWTWSAATSLTSTGLPLGYGHNDTTHRYSVARWALDGSLQWSVPGFDSIEHVVGNRNEVIATGVPHDKLKRRAMLFQDGALVRDFGALFKEDVRVTAINDSGVAVGYAVVAAADARTQAFTLNVRTGDRPYFFELPAGALSAVATAVNSADDVLVIATFPGGLTRSYLHNAGDHRDLGPYVLVDVNDSRLTVGYTSATDPRAGILDASKSELPWSELPMPAELPHSLGLYVNAKGHVAGYGWSAEPSGDLGFSGFLVDATGMRPLEDLAPGSYWIPLGLSDAGNIVTRDAAKRPVLLTTSLPVSVPRELGRPLWELILLGSTGDAPLFGLGGVRVVLPNGNAINLPAIPIPGEPEPRPDWRQLTQMERRALLAAALSSVARALQDQDARALLNQTARQLLGPNH